MINTHLHFDHAGNNALFAGVPIYVQRAHHEQALGNPAYPNETWNLPGLRYELLDGETELFPGVELLLTPGHAPAHQSLLVTLGSGRRVLLCADAILSRANVEHDNWESQADPAEARRSARRLLELAAEHDALMIFGHDPVQMHELTYAPGAYSWAHGGGGEGAVRRRTRARSRPSPRCPCGSSRGGSARRGRAPARPRARTPSGRRCPRRGAP